MTTTKTAPRATQQEPRPAARTRVEQLPTMLKGIKIPTGYTPAYIRKRQHLAVLRANDGTPYLVFDLKTGKYRETESTNSAAVLMHKVSQGTARLTSHK